MLLYQREHGATLLENEPDAQNRAGRTELLTAPMAGFNMLVVMPFHSKAAAIPTLTGQNLQTSSASG